jgi:hypothetical protein
MTDDFRRRSADEQANLTEQDMTKADENVDTTPAGRTSTGDVTRADDFSTTGADDTPGAPTGRPDWSREEWEGQNQRHRTALDPETRGMVDDAVTGAPHWNEHEFVGEGQGADTEGPDERVVPTEGSNELSGHGHNPGGGERWADVDRGPADR